MLTPEEIAERRFLVSLRGYDRDEVHAFLGELARQVGELQQRNAELTEESQRARAALHQVQDEADSAAAVTSAAASAETTEALDAEQPRRPFAEIGEETQRILEAAQEASNQIARKARQDADREIQAARQQAAKVIADGERRRDEMEQLIARLDERRTAVVSELRSVGQTIERAVSELVPDEDAPTVREALSATVEESAADVDAEAGPARLDGRVEPEDRGDPHAGDGRAVPDAAGSGEASGAETAPPDAVAADAVADVDRPAPEPDPSDPADASVMTTEAGLDEHVDAVADPVEDEVPDEQPPDDGGSDEEVTDDAESRGQPSSDAGHEGGHVTVVDDPVEQPPEAPATVPEPTGPGGLRAGALEPLHPKMVRRVKRGLSDLQNISLDRLRREGTKADADSLTVTDEELASLAEVAEEFLGQAYREGLHAAAVLAGSSLPEPDHDRALVEEFVADGGVRIREPLAASLRMGLGSDESVSALNDRIGAVFSELKSTAAGELSATHLIKAYELGLLDAWASGGISSRTWVLGREPRCPEGRCRQNDQSGAVQVTEPFPSGHEVPPIHVGCTCTTIPVLES